MVLMLVCLLGCGDDAAPRTAAAPVVSALTKAPPAREGVIVAVGDSLTAGYRVAEEDAYPARLQRRLEQDGRKFEVINAGISGETSSGTLARLDWLLTLKPDIMILETGANDGLRGIDPQLTHANIDAIVTRLKSEGVVVVLAGMRMIKNLGAAFTTEFENLYPAVAVEHGVILIPFFLEGVAGDRQLNQADGIHPTAAGYHQVVEHVYPFVVEALQLL